MQYPSARIHAKHTFSATLFSLFSRKISTHCNIRKWNIVVKGNVWNFCHVVEYINHLYFLTQIRLILQLPIYWSIKQSVGVFSIILVANKCAFRTLILCLFTHRQKFNHSFYTTFLGHFPHFSDVTNFHSAPQELMLCCEQFTGSLLYRVWELSGASEGSLHAEA